MNKAQRAVRNAIIDEYLTGTLPHLTGEAKALAPKLLGDLERDITFNPKVKETLIDFTGEVHAGGGTSAAYALRQHEELAPAMPLGVAQMQPGELTVKRSSSVGRAGGKYLERPLKHFAKKYFKMFGNRIKKALKS